MKTPAILGAKPLLDQQVYITRPVLPDKDRFFDAIRDIFERGWLTNSGPYVNRLEEKLREYLGVEHCQVFTNGTLSLQLMVQGLRLAGDVITTPFTFPATVHTLYWNHIIPQFCDVDPETYNITPEAIEAAITPNTTGIMPVHVYGNPCEVDRIQDVASKYGLKVCYDAAHAFGVKIGGRPIGTFGDANSFSFHATKLYNTMEGGAMTTRDANLAWRVQMYRNFGIKNEEEVIGPGINAKMHELQGAYGLLVLERIDEEIEARRRIARRYDEALAELPGLRMQRVREDVERTYQYYTIRIVPEEYGVTRDQLHRALKAEGIVTRKYFYPLCSTYACYASLPSAAPGRLPNAEKLAQSILCLPMFGQMEDRIVDVVIEALQSIHYHAPRVRKELG